MPETGELRNCGGQPISRLLRLPQELRLAIFEHLFADRDCIVVGEASNNPWKGRPCAYHPAPTRVSSQLRADALSVLYNKHHVLLILRYREGRVQIQEWLQFISVNSALSNSIRWVTIQYFETPHRSTVIELDARAFSVRNGDKWLHPLTSRPINVFQEITSALACILSSTEPSTPSLPDVLARLIGILMGPLNQTRLLRDETLTNLRLHGHSDFPLLIEAYKVLYYGCT